jgi:hypothetical protein
MRGSTILCLVLAGGLAVLAAPLSAQPPCGPDLRWTNRFLSERSAKIELGSGESYSRVQEIEVGAESLVGQFHGKRLEIKTADVRRIETLAKRHPLARFLRGLAIGVGVGSAIYLTTRNAEPFQTRSTVIVSGGAIGGGIGGIIGLAAPALDGEVICEGPKPPA